LLPTFHDQLIAPAELAVLSLSPAAVDGPDLYSTSIEQRAFADVMTETIAVLFRGTDAVRAVTFTASPVVAGGLLVAATLVDDDEATERLGAGAGVEPNGLA
jgi:hypothetical protein